MKNNIFSHKYKIFGLILCLIVFVILHISHINSEKIVKNIITNTTKLEIITSTTNTISAKNKPNIISKTLLAWKKNINNSNIFKNYDEKFKRTWNYYLLLCSAAFRARAITVFQLVYFKKDTQLKDGPYYIREQY